MSHLILIIIIGRASPGAMSENSMYVNINMKDYRAGLVIICMNDSYFDFYLCGQTVLKKTDVLLKAFLTL